MISTTPAIIAGAAAGLGLALVVRELMPSRPDLADALRRQDASRISHYTGGDEPAEAPDALEKVGRFLVNTIGDGVKVPAKDLDLLGKSHVRHLAQKFLLALYGLSLPAVVSAFAALTDHAFPIVIPAIAALGCAALFFVIPDASVKREAEQARLEFRVAIASYLELVALERAADAGAHEALKRAAAVGDGWVFARLRETLDRAELAGIDPWDGLRQLADELEIPQLAAPADIMSMAGREGAAVLRTLRAQARSLRGQMLSEQEAEANRTSEQMIVPVTALVIVMTLALGYPTFMTIMAS